MKTIVSGIQPTGDVHLGNYLGFIKNNIDFISVEKCEAFIFIADLHSITTEKNTSELRNEIIKIAGTYLACGLTPEVCNIFAQSGVHEHAVLSWILGCYTPLGWLNRMTQFKDKSSRYKAENASLGLYSYPTLMAADILLYQASFVPVGEDQVQHIELTRDIASAFNSRTKTTTFNLPEAVILKNVKRIMSLRDGKKKMSKSDESDYSRINLTDSPDEIKKKIQKARTDTLEGIYLDSQKRPEITNLLNIYISLSGMSMQEVVDTYSRKKFSAFKNDLTDIIINALDPIRIKLRSLLNDKKYIEEVLDSGQEKAQSIAVKTLKNVKEVIGFF